MIGYYNYTVILTYLGTFSGFIGMTYIWNKNLKMSLICLMISGFCDMFDGKIASTMKRTKQEKQFGIQIDSLNDLICFGVLPALIILEYTGKTFSHTFISFLYLLCALIRLAWFNIEEEERQKTEKESRKTYLGLPVTSSALLLPFIIGIEHVFHLSIKQSFPFVLLFIAIAFLLPIQLKKPGFIGKIIMLILGIISLISVIIGVTI